MTGDSREWPIRTPQQALEKAIVLAVGPAPPYLRARRSRVGDRPGAVIESLSVEERALLRELRSVDIDHTHAPLWAAYCDSARFR